MFTCRLRLLQHEIPGYDSLPSTGHTRSFGHQFLLSESLFRGYDSSAIRLIIYSLVQSFFSQRFS